MTKESCLALIVSASMVSAASAAPIVSVAFSSNDAGPSPVTDAGVIGDLGDTFDVVHDSELGTVLGGGVTLNDVDQNATVYTLSGTNLNGHSGGLAADSAGVGPLNNSWFLSVPGSLTLGGFTAGDVVDLVLFSTYHQPAALVPFQRGTTFTIDGNSQATTGTSNPAVAYVQDENYVFFDDLVVDGTGTIVIDLTPGGGLDAGGGFHDVNGLQFSVIPEPGSLAMIAMGGLFVLRRRRSN